jgi:20S proteasome subunit alpha 5
VAQGERTLSNILHCVYQKLTCRRAQSLTLEEAQVLALKILKQVMEEKLDDNNVELAQVVPSAKSKTGAQFTILNKDQLKAVIEKIETTSSTEEGQEGGQTSAQASGASQAET